MNTIYFDEEMSDDQRRQFLYQGQLFVYSPTPSSLGLCEFAREMCSEHFSPFDPRTAQHELDVEKYIQILAELKPKFIHHPESKRLIASMLGEFGCAPLDTYFDVPRLRTATAGDYLKSGLAYAFKPHRDTWYSTPMCQLNWWLPVFPIASNNTMAFHANYWKRPVRNSSQEFNYQDWNENGRKAAANQVKADSRRQSEALEDLQLNPQIRIVCKPGSVIVFSAAHLHSTVPNTTNETRFSIDFRTVHAQDAANDRGALNLDGESTGTTMMDYLRLSDLSHFPDSVIEQHKQKIPKPEFPTDMGK